MKVSLFCRVDNEPLWMPAFINVGLFLLLISTLFDLNYLCYTGSTLCLISGIGYFILAYRIKKRIEERYKSECVNARK